MPIEDVVGGIKRVIDTRVYEVADDSVVHLTITIGDGQVGGSSILFAGTVTQGAPNFTDFPINPTQSCKRKDLNCETRVADIQPTSDHTSVVYELTGGKQPEQFVYNTDVSENHGFA